MRFRDFYKTVIEEKSRGTKDERAIWLHGTSSIFLREILKKGLLSNPPKRVYGELGDATVEYISMDTYGGVYLTRDFLKAHVSADSATQKFGGNELYIIAQIQPKSLFADEDDITFHIPFKRRSVEDNMILYKSLKYGTDRKDDAFYNKEKGQFVNYLYSKLLNELVSPHSRITNTIYNLIKNDLWDAYVTRAFAYMLKDNSVRLQWEIYYKNLSLTNVPSPERAEKLFRGVVDKLTKIMRNMIRSNKDRAGRLLRDLTYSGNNKIIGIVEVAGHSLTVHYGKLNRDFLRAVINFKGELLTINGKQHRFKRPK